MSPQPSHKLPREHPRQPVSPSGMPVARERPAFHVPAAADWSLAARKRAMLGRALSLGLGAIVLCSAIAWQPDRTGAQSGQPLEYTLDALDKVRIRAHEWRPARDELFEWKALNAEYTVGASGKLALPVVGEIDVSGMTTAQVALAIGDRMKQRIGLVENPDVSVEVVECRPIYVVGQVARPGAFAFKPGLTVVQAVSLAGGIRRIEFGSRLEREIIQTQSDMILNATETRSLIARRARLEAEFDGSKEIKFPQSLLQNEDQEPVARLLQQERMVLEARRGSYKNQIEALRQLKLFLEQETTSLRGQIASHNMVVAIARKELETIAILVQKGLAVQTRKLGLERNMAQLEGDRLRMETTLAHNQQEIGKTALAIIDLNAKRDIELATDMRNTQARLDELAPRLETSKLLLEETEQAVPMHASMRALVKMEPTYMILRKIGRHAPVAEVQAEEMTAVQPGDTIKVRQATEADAGVTAISFSRWSGRSARDAESLAVGSVPVAPSPGAALAPEQKTRAPSRAPKPAPHQMLQ